jgi:hypothetical protein
VDVDDGADFLVMIRTTYMLQLAIRLQLFDPVPQILVGHVGVSTFY